MRFLLQAKRSNVQTFGLHPIHPSIRSDPARLLRSTITTLALHETVSAFTTPASRHPDIPTSRHPDIPTSSFYDTIPCGEFFLLHSISLRSSTRCEIRDPRSEIRDPSRLPKRFSCLIPHSNREANRSILHSNNSRVPSGLVGTRK